MKTLSVRQPWAWLIVQGIKTVENRTWATAYRGEFLIHASARFDLAAGDFDELREAVRADYGVWIPDDLPRGGIVGQARLADCLLDCSEENDIIWHEPGCYAFLLRDARPLPFQPQKGRLGFFDVHLSPVTE